MSSSTVQDQAGPLLQRLQTLRDEIRLRIHLGGMELKGLWSELEGKIFDAEKKIEGAAEDVLAKLQGLVPEVEAFSKKLTGQGDSQSSAGDQKQDQSQGQAKA
jgi:hypothetical protein